MELGLNKITVADLAPLQQRRANRAQWWFTQMRRVVDLAMEWKPAPTARPEQVYLTLLSKRS